MVAQIATLSDKEVPALIPLWFVCDGGHLYMGTGRATLSVRNITAHSRVVLILHAERHGKQNRVLCITGTATCHYKFPSWRVILRLAMKYYLSPRGSAQRTVAQAQVAPEAALLRTGTTGDDQGRSRDR
jgi:hypothetical protein